MNDKPLLFRFHRAGLDASMQTVIEISSFTDLMKIIYGDFINWQVEPVDIKISPYCYDSRIDWDTHIVSVTVTGHPNFFPVGFLNRKPDWSITEYEHE